MNAWNILAIVLAIGVIALVGFMIPILIQVKDLLKMMERTVTRLEKDVEPVLQNVGGITMNVEGLTEAANSFVHRKSSNEPGLVDKIKDNVEENVNLVKEEYIPLISQRSKDYFKALKIGFNVAFSTFRKSRPVKYPLIKKDLRLELVEKPANVTQEVILVGPSSVQ